MIYDIEKISIQLNNGSDVIIVNDSINNFKLEWDENRGYFLYIHFDKATIQTDIKDGE